VGVLTETLTIPGAFIMERPMSDPAAPHPGQRPLPQTTLQFAGHAADSVVSGLSGRSPYMLGIVVLNVLGIAAAIYFLNILITGQQKHLAALLDVQEKQQTEIVTLHKQEFDMLLQMIPRYEAQAAPALTIPPPAPQTPPAASPAPLPAQRR
jgi:hypothetical protein